MTVDGPAIASVGVNPFHNAVFPSFFIIFAIVADIVLAFVCVF